MTDAYRELIREYRGYGWTVTLTGGGHLKWLPPGGGQPVFSPSTPSDVRSIDNTRARLKRVEQGRRA